MDTKTLQRQVVLKIVYHIRSLKNIAVRLGAIILVATAGISCSLLSTTKTSENPCITISTCEVDFGEQPIGKSSKIDVKITSCGKESLMIYTIGFLDSTDSDLAPDPLHSLDFSLDLSGFPNAEQDPTQIPSEDQPIIIETDASVTFKVVFTPDEISPKDPNGKPIPDVSIIAIKSNTNVPDLAVYERGSGVKEE